VLRRACNASCWLASTSPLESLKFYRTVSPTKQTMPQSGCGSIQYRSDEGHLLRILGVGIASAVIIPANNIPKQPQQMLAVDWPAPHLLPSAISTCRGSIVGFQQFGCRAHMRHSWIEPQIVAVGVEDDWHSVMDSSGHGIRSRGQNREGSLTFCQRRHSSDPKFRANDSVVGWFEYPQSRFQHLACGIIGQ
jgi:hypothetical protein